MSFPQGCKGLILSKIIFTIAKNGMLKNIPEIPHNLSPINIAKKENNALIFTLEPTTNGKIILPSIAWIATKAINTYKDCVAPPVEKEIRQAINVAENIPK